ncbi:MAG: alpha/beta fold hydrolase [Acetobacteraceae bacterium]
MNIDQTGRRSRTRLRRINHSIASLWPTGTELVADLPMTHRSVPADALAPPPAPAPSLSAAAGRLAASAADLDVLLHAGQGQATRGLSLVGQGMALLDWGVHMANAPFQATALGLQAAVQMARLPAAALGGTMISPSPSDHRFADPAWSQPPFSVLSQSFLLMEEWLAQVAARPAGVSRGNQRVVSFLFRQLADIVSPSNLPWLNPEVIRTTTACGGRNFLHGLVHMLADLRDLTAGNSRPSHGFRIGQDLAATPGQVVLRNELIELIQYTPTTPAVRAKPVLIVPAWIMKYYILDLSKTNSLIRYLVDQGYTVFAISWRNPDAAMRDTTMDDYRIRGVMAALDAVTDVCGGQRVQACGYCLGGTLLSIAAAAMARDGDDRLASMTLFCAQTDFTEAGELQLFITEDQLAFLDDVMRVQGYLDSRQMAGSFQLLRANDLIWSRMIRSYMLGEPEHPSDLMAWNADGTRMPARMHSEYLHRLFLDNELAEGRFPAGGRPVALNDIHVPLFVVATETDHIAPWRSVYKITLLNDSDLVFVLASGGHNAGVVSEPGHPHRHFRLARRVAGGLYVPPDEWQAKAAKRPGSWWPAWVQWLDEQAGPPSEPPPLGSKRYAPLEAAPGRYVHEH